MRLYQDDVKVTMTGLQEAFDFVSKIDEKTRELRDLVTDFERHCLALGIDIVRTEKEPANSLENAVNQT